MNLHVRLLNKRMKQQRFTRTSGLKSLRVEVVIRQFDLLQYFQKLSLVATSPGETIDKYAGRKKRIKTRNPLARFRILLAPRVSMHQTIVP